MNNELLLAHTHTHPLCVFIYAHLSFSLFLAQHDGEDAKHQTHCVKSSPHNKLFKWNAEMQVATKTGPDAKQNFKIH